MTTNWDRFVREDDDWKPVEADDWEMEGSTDTFVSFKETPGRVLLFITGNPDKGRTKYNKDQFWFPVNVVVDVENGMMQEMIMSTASSQLRKLISAMKKKIPTIFEGKEPLMIQWTGSGMERKYSVTDLAYESKIELLRSLGMH